MMNPTEQCSLPPTSLTLTLIDPDAVELGAEIVGPGMEAEDSGEGAGTVDGVGEGEGDGSDGLMSNLLISRQDYMIFQHLL